MTDAFSPTHAEQWAARLCTCSLSQAEAWSRAVLRVAAEPCLAAEAGRLETQDGLHGWSVCPLPIPQHGIMGMCVRMDFDVPMQLREFREDEEAPALSVERLSAVARRMVSWLRHPLFAESVKQTWQRAARTERQMCFHVSCDPDGYAYAISIRFVPAQGEKQGAAAMELLVMNRLHPCWCAEALHEVNGELRPHFLPGTDALFYRPCIPAGLK